LSEIKDALDRWKGAKQSTPEKKRESMGKKEFLADFNPFDRCLRNSRYRALDRDARKLFALVMTFEEVIGYAVA
jgi:hypothetical protein